MKWLCAGLSFVNFAALCGLVLGKVAGGLNYWVALVSVGVGMVFAVVAYFATADPRTGPDVAESNEETEKLRAQRRRERTVETQRPTTPYKSIWLWLLAGCFALFALRSFCWLLYTDGGDLRIQSPNNLGDLALHITFIKDFANGVSIWPDNPIYITGKLRYPAGIDLFNALLTCLHVDLARGLIWTGLLASLATFYAFYRWGGAFGIAGFLFNGGLTGFQFFKTFKFLDYQGDKTVAWKSIPLAMFVTQRGLLYAIPAGLLLLWHWREKFFGVPGREPVRSGHRMDRPRAPLPFWIELSLYASMPLFHAHTFMALSAVLLFLFICGDAEIRWHVGSLVAGALLPATFFVWLTSDNFHASSMLKWQPGWVLNDVHLGRSGWFDFWFTNFGILIPIVVALLGVCGWRVYRSHAGWKFELFGAVALGTIALCVWRIWETGFNWSFVIFFAAALSLLGLISWRVYKTGFTWDKKLPEEIMFLSPAIAIFIAGLLFKFAPWEWDNLKIIIWAYFLVLPFLWSELIAPWQVPVRAGVCVVLFASGFVCLFGGLRLIDGKPGFTFANRAELATVAVGVRKIPVEARFACFPTYNHPLLLNGRKVVMGYPGHLWSLGFDEYAQTEAELGVLMRGEGGWKTAAKNLGARYLFWGEEEKNNYPTSKWEHLTNDVKSGQWGAIYDLEVLAQSNP